MLSYRHAFHAGNPADVLKHTVLAASLAYLTRKPAPLLYIDTHAGAGSYRLDSDIANKTGEYRDGVLALDWSTLEAPVLAPYREAVEAPLAQQRYPGSPQIAASLLREQDRLRLFELHPQDFATLSKGFYKDARVKVAQTDGFASLRALLPAPQKRALVMIDPSYEVKQDYERVVDALQEAYRRMPGATYLLWYPVVLRQRIERLERGIKAAGLKDVWQFELGTAPDSEDYGMTASGMVVVNPPWELPEQMRVLLPQLQQQLAPAWGNHRCTQWVAE